MSCGLALAVALAAAPMSEAPAAAATVAASAAPVAVAHEPLFVDIVDRARTLEETVKAWRDLVTRDAPAPLALPGFETFKSEAAALAGLDMKAHVELKARNADGDLKCILRGISEDLPKKIAAVEAAGNGAAQFLALDELAYLLNDNVGVITAPPKPPV